MRLSKNKRIESIARRLLKSGWHLKSFNGHARIASADGKLVVTVPSTPSCSHAELNWIHQLRRSGVDKALLC